MLTLSSRSLYRLLLCGGLVVASAGGAQAQTGLVGRWSLQQIAFEAPATLPDSLQEQLFHSPAADTNIGITNGELTLIVEFKADSTYTYTTSRRGRTVHSEQGTYGLRQGKLYSQAATKDSPLFDGQSVVQLTRRKLLLQSPILAPELQVFEQILYMRLPKTTK
ncbi:hypothetical protein KBK19_07750 [Microvirga sp. STR05]|uniref:Lipocalin-like domain-containing protein n=1 Tax=Hymenobacter duratus TaxID=2771356 RepID=A0ABR8JK70_9BACT|nr:hypothetical protein [Hymenobacter duratus]MBD2714924.1 hypothetical protein [Hymenobacter duratus]MBR7949830.1 hypothetical protein [Microvirga sp. STR05]